MRIAYIDDSIENLEVMELALADDFEIKTFSCEDKFLNQDLSTFSAIILDIHMPGKGGFELYNDILSSDNYSGNPIFFISSDETDEIVVRSFQLGAVDFIPRRISLVELKARIQSRIEFHSKHKTIIEFDGLKLNLSQLSVSLHGKLVKITFTELKLLNHILRSYPEISPKDEIAKSVWGKDYALDGTIYTHISNLNTKLKGWNYEVVAERMKGISLKKR